MTDQRPVALVLVAAADAGPLAPVLAPEFEPALALDFEPFDPAPTGGVVPAITSSAGSIRSTLPARALVGFDAAPLVFFCPLPPPHALPTSTNAPHAAATIPDESPRLNHVRSGRLKRFARDFGVCCTKAGMDCLSL
jgi:hypothetical protein